MCKNCYVLIEEQIGSPRFDFMIENLPRVRELFSQIEPGEAGFDNLTSEGNKAALLSTLFGWALIENSGGLGVDGIITGFMMGLQAASLKEGHDRFKRGVH